MSNTDPPSLRDVRRQIRGRMVGTPLGTTDDDLARRGIELAEDVWRPETLRRWADPGFAAVEWDTAIERDEAALTLGEHRNHIRDEGRATHEAWRGATEAGNPELAARFKKRAAGLLWAVAETGRLIGRLGRTPLGEPVKLSQIDVVNLAVGLDTYHDIIVDHHRGMKRLTDRVEDAGDLARFFDEDFTALTHTHWDMEGVFYGDSDVRGGQRGATDFEVETAVERAERGSSTDR